MLRETVSVWDTFELSADEFVGQGDTVVVTGHADVSKGDRSGRLPLVHIWRSRGGSDWPLADSDRLTRDRKDFLTSLEVPDSRPHCHGDNLLYSTLPGTA